MQIELYEFATTAATYRYTSASEDVSAWGVTFTAVPISRGELVGTDDLNQAKLDITSMRDLPYVTAAMANREHGTVTVYVWDGDDEAWETAWKGRVVSIALSGAEATIATESILTAARRLGFYGKYQLLCRHVLYGTDCGLDRDTYDFAGTVDGLSGNDVTVTGLNGEADGYYTCGYARFGALGYGFITAHAGNVITLFAPVVGLAIGESATVYAGCDRLFATCRDKFSNAANFGGFPWLPQKPKLLPVPAIVHPLWR